MLFSRWKVMTGVIGISIGGLAALAGQGPKPEQVSQPIRVETKPAPAPSELPPPSIPSYAHPVSVELPTVPPSAPSLPPAKPVSKPLPELTPLPESKLPTPSKPEVSALPPKGEIIGLTPAGVFTPDLDVPVRAANAFAPPVVVAPPATAYTPPTVPTTPPSIKAVPSAPSAPPVTITSVETALPIIDVAPTAPKAVAVAPALPTKFRIVLRVGEGDPTFEVRHNDDLVMKVACEKVDIKSPERGGSSNVIATGKVRFVGFGAEGTCDSFSFLAGTGEVALSGNVNVKVRDKIGRIESELIADKMQYKLDSTALTGVLKP